jgi:hypothetical protein
LVCGYRSGVGSEELRGGNSGIGHRVRRWDVPDTERSGNHDRHAAPSATRVKKTSFLKAFFAAGLKLLADLGTRPGSRLRKMFPGQGHPNANNHAQQKADDETKSGCVTH